jgi:hypothetical protein
MKVLERWFVAAMWVLAPALLPAAASAQADAGGDRSAGVAVVDGDAGILVDVENAAEAGGGSTWLVGRTPERRRLIPGLFVMHPYDPQFPEMDWTRGGGFQFSTWFGAAFMNSYDRFSIIAGVERNWYHGQLHGVGFGVGYRAGILTGYDERLMELAGKTPVLPFAGLLLFVDLGPVSLDSFYVYKAMTVETSFDF